MDKLYLKNYAIWLGGAIAIDWLLSYAGMMNFLYEIAGGAYWIISLIFILPGVIAGTVVTHKALGKNIEFGKAVGPVLTIIGGFGLLGFLIFMVRFGGEDFASYVIVSIVITLFYNLAFGVSILLAVGTWYMFEKASKPGWAFLVPIYNIVCWCEIAKKPGWWIVLLLIPIVNIIILIMILNGISKNFGKDTGFTVGLVFFRAIFFAILGYGDAQYNADASRDNDHVLDGYSK